jgi:transcriptional regulator GlxA family with amidase domain
MELGIVHRLFGQAVSAGGDKLYEVVTCTLSPGEIRTDADFGVTVSTGVDALSEADTVVIPASTEDYESTDAQLLGPLTEALARIRPGTRLASICTGSFVLAAAGLLDGRPATTHWKSAEQFQALFPLVELDPDVLYTDDGDILTAAGVASGIDLCLHMIRCDHGSSVANAVARTTMVPPHRDGGQAQFIQRPVPDARQLSTAAVRAWALEHLDRPLTLCDLAARESMSKRTFTRRFRDEVGVSPGQWLAQQRVERARELLEKTDLAVDRIAEDAGFGTAASLRQHLQTSLGVSPSAYRRTFRGPAASPSPAN